MQLAASETAAVEIPTRLLQQEQDPASVAQWVTH